MTSFRSSSSSWSATGFTPTTTSIRRQREGIPLRQRRQKQQLHLWFWKRRPKQTPSKTNEEETKQQEQQTEDDHSPREATTTTTTATQLFREFVDFLQTQQDVIIHQIENDVSMERNSGVQFSNDAWGIFDKNNNNNNNKSGGRTRVMQGGRIIEKGACSLTVIEQGILTSERAANIRARSAAASHDTNPINIQAGDSYSAAALSVVLHSRSPFVPTFRSDVRVFLVQSQTKNNNQKNNDDHRTTDTTTMAWFGGGADLTPYYLFSEDIQQFHRQYRDLCNRYFVDNDESQQFGYTAMKKACDAYFYLPARQEHRGTGGIFFDDLMMMEDSQSLEFVKALAQLWMPSWIPIVQRRGNTPYTERQKYWQKIRRGRYLEFNLLYDVRVQMEDWAPMPFISFLLFFFPCSSKLISFCLVFGFYVFNHNFSQRGVKFGLLTPNPRVEGVMVSAPPEIAYPYNHVIEPESPEAQLLEVLKSPRSWVD
jgi:coproporphyrinogen III oxidase